MRAGSAESTNEHSTNEHTILPVQVRTSQIAVTTVASAACVSIKSQARSRARALAIDAVTATATAIGSSPLITNAMVVSLVADLEDGTFRTIVEATASTAVNAAAGADGLPGSPGTPPATPSALTRRINKYHTAQRDRQQTALQQLQATAQIARERATREQEEREVWRQQALNKRNE